MEGPRKITLRNIDETVAKRQAQYLIEKQLDMVAKTGYPHLQHNVYSIAPDSNQVQMLHDPENRTITLFDSTINRSTSLSYYLLAELRSHKFELVAHEGPLPGLSLL